MRSLLKTISQRMPFLRQGYMFLRHYIAHRPFVHPAIQLPLIDGRSILIDYVFARHRYDHFGDRHNAGLRQWLAACSGQDVIFDVGAHIGLYALPAAKEISAEGKIYAFEPSHANCRYLSRHLEYNRLSNVNVNNVLVGGEDREETDFYENDRADAMNAMLVQKNVQDYRLVKRRQITLDRFCAEKDLVPQVIKIDVEGAELKVLKGARDVLTTHAPRIFLSVHPKRMEAMGDAVQDLVDCVHQWGYDIMTPEGQPADKLEFGEYILRKRG